MLLVGRQEGHPASKKTEWWGAGMVISMERGADLRPSWCHCHSLSLASVKSRLVLTFWYWLTRIVPEKGPLNGCVCVCAVPVLFGIPFQTQFVHPTHLTLSRGILKRTFPSSVHYPVATKSSISDSLTWLTTIYECFTYLLTGTYLHDSSSQCFFHGRQISCHLKKLHRNARIKARYLQLKLITTPDTCKQTPACIKCYTILSSPLHVKTTAFTANKKLKKETSFQWQ